MSNIPLGKELRIKQGEIPYMVYQYRSDCVSMHACIIIIIIKLAIIIAKFSNK